MKFASPRFQAVFLIVSLSFFFSFATAAETNSIWADLRDIPTGMFPNPKGYRVFFAEHAGVYYLLKSSPTFKKDASTVKKAIRDDAYLKAEAEATYLSLRNVRRLTKSR